MTELERALVAVGQELELPPQPDLVAGVRAGIEGRRLFGWRAVAFAAALVVVAFGIAMAVPPARSAILRLFHVGAATVEQVDTLPAARQRPLAAGLGPPMARRSAELRAHLPIKLPDLEGPKPTRYYAQPGLIATLLSYRGTPVLLAEMRDDQVALFKKFTSPSSTVEPVELGRAGLWVKGNHVLTWQFGLADTRQIETRLAGNVLIWVVGNTTYRLEGELAKSQMLELAHRITP
jgi:hypothetical protein